MIGDGGWARKDMKIRVTSFMDNPTKRLNLFQSLFKMVFQKHDFVI